MNGHEKPSDDADRGVASGRSRIGRLTLISLALNIFFIGAAGALAVRHYIVDDERQAGGRGDNGPARRIEALAVQLPADDAAILRSEYARLASAAEAARETQRRSREAVRQALQAEPYDPAAVRAAMAASREAHVAFIGVLHDVVAAAAVRMSPAARAKVGEASLRSRRRKSEE